MAMLPRLVSRYLLMRGKTRVLSWMLAFLFLVLVVKVIRHGDHVSPSDPVSLRPGYERGLAMERRQELRKAHLQQVCTSDVVSWNKVSVVVDPKVRLAFCHMPTAGLTNLMRVYRYLNSDLHPAGHTDPFTMPRFLVHYAQLKFIQILKISETDTSNPLPDYRRAIFVREPFSRLFAYYVEKFVLPEYWWEHGRRLARNRVSDKLEDKSEEVSLRCGHDVTFKEFLSDVVDSITNSRNINTDLLPVWQKCNPCAIHYDVVGTMETFNEDFSHFLDAVSLEHLQLQHQAVRVDFSHEVVNWIDYVMQWAVHFAHEECRDFQLLVNRLWEVLKMRGLLPPEAKVPSVQEWRPERDVPSNSSITLLQVRLTEVALRQQEKAEVTSASRNEAWYEAMKQAYATVPWTLVRKIRTIYGPDFDLFGYNRNPPFV